MTICIIDPAAHIPSLKKLFPAAEYFAHEPDSFFTFTSTPHYTKEQIYRAVSYTHLTLPTTPYV